LSVGLFVHWEGENSLEVQTVVVDGDVKMQPVSCVLIRKIIRKRNLLIKKK
jgi:hypothetical protein